MYVFPTDIPEPIIPAASNSGSTYTEVLTDSTITSTTDANYKITRPRTTRVIGSWTYTWLGLSDENYEHPRSLSLKTIRMGKHTDVDL